MSEIKNIKDFMESNGIENFDISTRPKMGGQIHVSTEEMLQTFLEYLGTGTPCLKQRVVAIVVKDGKVVGKGENLIKASVSECPRVTKGCKTGEGYEMCNNICNQQNHAEVNACLDAGDKTKGAKIYIFGHTYACGSCTKACYDAGIEEIIFADTGMSLPLLWENKNIMVDRERANMIKYTKYLIEMGAIKDDMPIAYEYVDKYMEK